MDPPCGVFDELYRLWDRERKTGEPIGSTALRHMVDLCNFCALCPCPNIRSDLIEAKTRFARRDGLATGAALLQDVERLARTCGMFPNLFNRLVDWPLAGGLLKKGAGIHRHCRLPKFPAESFDASAAGSRLRKLPQDRAGRKVVYFAGCTGRYLFPEVPQAAAAVLERLGAAVHFPRQRCCGMPPFLEGDRDLALSFARENVARLAGLVADGYAVVCTCPTCAFMLRKVIPAGACYSSRYQEAFGGDEDSLFLPTNRSEAEKRFVKLPKTIYGGILKDDGYFSSIDPLARIAVAQNTWDLGEYLLHLHKDEGLDLPGTEGKRRSVYFAPCHQREQEFGTPYAELMEMVSGTRPEVIDGRFYCCGMAGIMGFKKEFRDASVRMGQPLIKKIRQLNPEVLVTDCLSCRLQFRQTLPYPVRHPIEVIKDAIDPPPSAL